MSLFGRVFKALFKSSKGTPERVSPPEEIRRPAPTSDLPQFDSEPVSYPPGWNANDREFWDKEVKPEFERYYTPAEWEAAQEAFEQGWMFPHRSKEAVQPYRDEFFRISTLTEDQFDWKAFREWYANN